MQQLFNCNFYIALKCPQFSSFRYHYIFVVCSIESNRFQENRIPTPKPPCVHLVLERTSRYSILIRPKHSKFVFHSITFDLGSLLLGANMLRNGLDKVLCSQQEVTIGRLLYHRVGEYFNVRRNFFFPLDLLVATYMYHLFPHF